MATSGVPASGSSQNLSPARQNFAPPDEDTVRGGHYAMWRRLFLQDRNPPDTVNDPTGAIRQANCVAWTGSASRCTEEQKLYDWATNRQNMCNICVYAGFYDPIPGCNVPIHGCNDPLNKTCLTAEAGLGTPKMNTGAEAPGTAKHGATCDTAYPCVANGQIASAAGGDCGAGEGGARWRRWKAWAQQEYRDRPRWGD